MGDGYGGVMSNPQQPELARSRKTPAQDQDAVAGVVEGQRAPETTAPGGPVPEDNQPGHHPPEEQDKPDLQAFAERLGTAPATAETSGSHRGSGTGSPAAAVVSAARDSGPRARVAAVFAAVAVLIGLVVTTKRRRSRR